jgi:hypothetical protein
MVSSPEYEAIGEIILKQIQSNQIPKISESSFYNAKFQPTDLE